MSPSAGLAVLLLAVPLAAQHTADKPRPAHQSKVAGRMSDAEAADLAKEALRAEDPASIRSVLQRLRSHTFKSSRAPEREMVLYAQGMLEARLGNLSGAAFSLRKLEKQWPRSPFTSEAQPLLAEDAVARRAYKEAEGRLHRALAADIPSERKRKAQELLLWTLVEQGRPLDGVPIVQALRPLEGKDVPSEKGMVAIVEVLCAAGDRAQVEGSRKAFLTSYPSSPLVPRVDLAYGRLLGRSGDAKGSAEVLRKLIQDHPSTPQSDDARLALASLLTDGSLPDAKDMPSVESLLAEVRKGGRNLPKGLGQIVELRMLVGKSLWEDALNLVARMDATALAAQPEIQKLWREAWNAWVGERLEKDFPGELLARMKPGAFGSLEAKHRVGVAELLATSGLLEVLPGLIAEAPARERSGLRRAALAKVEPEAQPQAVLRLLPGRGESREEALLRARSEVALGHWTQARAALGRAPAGPGRIATILRLLQRPLAAQETTGRRQKEAEGWLAGARERGEVREPLEILVADLRLQSGDPHGALSLYPQKASAPEQRGWVALMRAQALLKLGQAAKAKALILAARDESGFKGQRDALARSLGVY